MTSCEQDARWLWQLFAIVFFRQLHTPEQSLASRLVLRERRLDAGHRASRPVCSETSSRRKLGRLSFLCWTVQAELEVLRVNPADTDIGDVPHRAHRQGNIESGFALGTVRAFQLSEPLHPPGPVVVFRIETFCVGPPEYLNHLSYALCRSVRMNPRQRISRRTIEIVNIGAIVREVWPTKVVQATRLNRWIVAPFLSQAVPVLPLQSPDRFLSAPRRSEEP